MTSLQGVGSPPNGSRIRRGYLARLLRSAMNALRQKAQRKMSANEKHVPEKIRQFSQNSFSIVCSCGFETEGDTEMELAGADFDDHVMSACESAETQEKGEGL